MTTPTTVAAPPEPGEPTGPTAADLFATLWSGATGDVYVSRAMGVRLFPIGPGFNDTVWLTEPPEPPVCYFRVTPPRFVGLLLRLKARKEARAALAPVAAGDTPVAAEAAAKAADLERVIERDTAALKLIKAEFQARWPGAVAGLAGTVPEDLDEPPCPADAWRDRSEVTAPAAPVAPPLDGADADLLTWARTAEPPAAPFCPAVYCVVLDARTWFDRLVTRAAGDAPAARPAALDRLRNLRVTPPAAARPDAADAARRLAARTGGDPAPNAT